MSDNDVVKALEYCAEGGYCGDCGYDIKSAKCIAKIMKDSIDLITSQNAEIERLRECPKCVYEYDGEMTEFCVKAPCSNYKTADEIRSEAIKEFAKRLKKEINDAIQSNHKALIDRAKSGIIDDVFSEYCKGKIHALSGIDAFIEEMVGDLE